MRHLWSGAESLLGSPIRNLVTILIFVVSVTALSTIAYMAAGWSFTDASYMVLLTIYTVGYGEVRPVDTQYLHIVTVATMVLGCTGMILLTSALVQFFTVIQLRSILGATRMQARIDKLNHHVVICGYGRIGQMLASDLAEAKVPLVVIEREEARFHEAEEAGHLCLHGEATDEDVLISAGVRRARALATVLPNDASNVFISLSARSLNPDVEIIARGEAPTTDRKLRHAGADHIVFPTHIGAERIARMILFPRGKWTKTDDGVQASRAELGKMGLELERTHVPENAEVCGMTVATVEKMAESALFIVQIRRGDEHITRPASDDRIEAGDELLIVMRNASRAARTLFQPHQRIRSGRNWF
ncbi:potassium channel family protein [Stakelama tenebrarum]|uniref:Potassium channel protein n=1 Tax=Stakelama tenebrarum TaxID=2711215 RepID=A0A6G6Y7H1_9SPHN|nr:potassium channel protein [Sphingosinithalassobacter tenebrarum]QIG80523.1 potassium channel protein [Sphingosinithalassobacter tenebrarum]